MGMLEICEKTPPVNRMVVYGGEAHCSFGH